MHSLSKDEILRLLAAARASSESDWLMILVAYLHGLRVSEVIALTRENVIGNVLRVHRLKGSETTEQELFEHENPLLNERKSVIAFCAKIPKSDPLFPISRATFWRRIKRYFDRAGLPAHLAHPHTLKHSCGRQAYDSQGIAFTQAWLGHKSGASSLQYTKPTEQEIRAAARKAFGE